VIIASSIPIWNEILRDARGETSVPADRDRRRVRSGHDQPSRDEVRPTGWVRIAYQVLGAGPPDRVLARRSYSHIDIAWEDPGISLFLRTLATGVHGRFFSGRWRWCRPSLP
jgi:hypothetical protein